ncbi:unnamed protein product, partial [Iphiclides podalirius]
MEKRKESLSGLKLCRFCLSKNQSLVSLYDRRLSPKNCVDLPLKILSCVSIEVFPSDKMPSYICSYCKFFMDLVYKYKQIVRQADENILKYIQNGTPLESLTWPNLLIKAYQSSVRHDIMRVEGGATVQVSTHDVSDSEDEEEESVYNIADGSDDGSKGVSTCIKVVTSKDDQDSSQNMLNQTDKGEGPYHCKHCTKSFTKSHHYTRHLRLKHRENIRSSRGPFGEAEQYPCDQCDEIFATQDELIYHSAIHATKNLTCPLCEEKFANVDAVTTHIKSHVNGVEFMCDFCELVFTTKEKLEYHLIMAHEDEFNNDLGQDDSSMEMDAREDDGDDDDNDTSINVKDKGDHMLIEIKKADEYMLHNTHKEMEEKFDNTNSEDSEPEVTYTELSTVDTLGIIQKGNTSPRMSVDKQPTKVSKATVSSSFIPALTANDAQTPAIIRKIEEKKLKATEQQSADTERKEKSTKIDSSSVGASNKSLQLLEKELQELKRTNNSRNEVIKTSKLTEPIRNRRLQIHASTPKAKPIEEKKAVAVTKAPVVEKKGPERRIITKENKEPKESKETKVNTSTKEDRDKDATSTPKSLVKNGNNEKNSADEGGIRRSTRPSKVKDYAKMIRDRQDEDDSDDADDEEYRAERTPERTRGRKSVTKVQAKMIQTTIATTTQSKLGLTAGVAPTPRKRGRPRKEPPKEVPAKVKKDAVETIEEINLTKTDTEDSPNAEERADNESKISISSDNSSDAVKMVSSESPQTSGQLVSPSGQPLKKVPVKALPPGVRPLALPVTPRPLGTGELCEMQIGKKMVKVQKIVMTKAEVEAMAKKGLVEMKDGTMVLKQGIKLPTADPVSIKSSLVGDGDVVKERKDKAAPTRCDLGDDP